MDRLCLYWRRGPPEIGSFSQRLMRMDPITWVLIGAALLIGGTGGYLIGDAGEDDSGQGKGEAGGARVEADGDQRVEHRDVALHRQGDGQVH